MTVHRCPDIRARRAGAARECGRRREHQPWRRYKFWRCVGGPLFQASRENSAVVGFDKVCMMTFNPFSIHLEQNQGNLVLSHFIQVRRSLLVASTPAVRLRDTSTRFCSARRVVLLPAVPYSDRPPGSTVSAAILTVAMAALSCQESREPLRAGSVRGCCSGVALLPHRESRGQQSSKASPARELQWRARR